MYSLLEIQRYNLASPNVNQVGISKGKAYIEALKAVKTYEEVKKYEDYVEIQIINGDPINENELKTYQIVELDS